MGKLEFLNNISTDTVVTTIISIIAIITSLAIAVNANIRENKRAREEDIRLKFEYEKNENQRFIDNKGELFLYNHKIGDRGYIVLENVGNSPVKIKELIWISDEKLTTGILLGTEDKDVLFEEIYDLTLFPRRKIRYAEKPLSSIGTDYIFNPKEYKLLVRYETMGREIKAELEIARSFNIEMGPRRYKDSEKTKYTILDDRLRDIADELSRL